MEPTLVPLDPSKPLVDMHSKRDDSGDCIKELQEQTLAKKRYVTKKGQKSEKYKHGKEKGARYASSLESRAPEEVLNRVEQSLQHLHNLAEGKYDRAKDHLFGKSVE